MKNCLAKPSCQQGVVLFAALIFMIMLTLLGINAAMNSGLEERMAGNTRNRDLAFQAAEAALKEAQNTYATWSAGPWNGSGGLNDMTAGDTRTDNTMTYWGDVSNWTSYRTTTVSGVAENPRYIIDKLPLSGTTEHYRVTARGVGGDSNAVVILQVGISFTPSP